MVHEPIQFGPGVPRVEPASSADAVRPRSMELKKDAALTIHWSDGRVSVYPVGYLRKHSPSAESVALREEMASNPLTVLPSTGVGTGQPMVAESAELVGKYALRIRFSDGHDTGIYTWSYLRSIDPARQ